MYELIDMLRPLIGQLILIHSTGVVFLHLFLLVSSMFSRLRSSTTTYVAHLQRLYRTYPDRPCVSGSTARSNIQSGRVGHWAAHWIGCRRQHLASLPALCLSAVSWGNGISITARCFNKATLRFFLPSQLPSYAVLAFRLQSNSGFSLAFKHLEIKNMSWLRKPNSLLILLVINLL